MSMQRHSSKSSSRTGIGSLAVGWFLIAITRLLRGKVEQAGLVRKSPGLRADTAAGRGRKAKSPGEIPAVGWKDIAWRVYRAIQRDRILLVAAGVTYYGLLALFPATATVVSIYGFFADPGTINEQINSLGGLLPGGALEVIGEQAKRIAAQGRGTLGFASAFSLLLSLWGANAGTKSVFEALNIIYKEEEKRGFLRFTLTSLAFTVGGVLLAILGTAAIVITPVALHLFGFPTASTAWFLSLVRWPVLLAAVLFALACLYRYGPSRTEPKWRWVTWGSATAAAVWLVGSILFSWYVANFGTYNKTYGSLGAVVGAMIWMWLSSIIILIGAEINAQIEHQTVEDSTEGVRKPMGTRGAHMADTVGKSHA
jgi:membrane protein